MNIEVSLGTLPGDQKDAPAKDIPKAKRKQFICRCTEPHPGQTDPGRRLQESDAAAPRHHLARWQEGAAGILRMGHM